MAYTFLLVYVILMRVTDGTAREFYAKEAAKSGWSVRQLERQNGILLCADKSDTLVRYTLPEDNKQIYAAKYLPYMPIEEELRRELNLEDFKKLD